MRTVVGLLLITGAGCLLRADSSVAGNAAAQGVKPTETQVNAKAKVPARKVVLPPAAKNRDSRDEWKEQYEALDFSYHIRKAGFGGLEVRKVAAGSMHEKLGLRQGDVITGVNGEALADAVHPEVYFDLLTARRIQRLDILQRGRTPAVIHVSYGSRRPAH